jgi:hypothetical protein
MRYDFHVVYSDTLIYDRDGQSFATFDVARLYALRAIKHFFLSHPNPRRRLQIKSNLFICDVEGDVIEVVPFIEAFASDDASSVIHCEPGNA